MEIKKTIETDVLVIGGGGAGERAAYEAFKQGVKVSVVVKGELGNSGCTTRSFSELSAYSAAFAHSDPRDNSYLHYSDTVYQGNGLCNEKLVRILTQNAPKRMLELDRAGCKFVKNGNKYEQLLADASTVPRACHYGADTGRQIAGTLANLIRKTNINIYENIVITKLLTFNGTVTGALGIDIKKESIILFKAKSVVLATGGGGQIYSLSGQPEDITGDGFSLAVRAGAELVNMEFIQFGPALVYPITGYLLVTNFWRLNPKLYNKDKIEFLDKYIPDDLTKEDVIRAKQFAFPFIINYPAMYLDIAMHSEITNGNGTEHGGIFLDISHNAPEVIENKVPVTFKWLLDRGVDIRKQPIEIAPVAQCFIGGVKFNEFAETNVPGLYVCGEVGGGLHGAARPGGNLLAISQVFGHIAGISAAKRALPISSIKIDQEQVDNEIKRLNSLIKNKAVNPQKIIDRLRKAMWNNVSIVKNKDGLEKTLNIVNELRRVDWLKVGTNSPKNILKIIELDFMLDVSSYVIRASLERKESRGTFYRDDYPKINNCDFSRIFCLTQECGETKLRKETSNKLDNFYIC